ncbi:MAG: prolyl oligopeptidase family serine peptidase [Acidobacteria bacterium]|nr:prolyl oligopeptidase family serine peptidase [Acidobacteriota bacterium]
MPRQQISVLVDPLRKLLRRGATGNTANMLRKLHAADVARLIYFLNDEQQETVFSLMLREAPGRAADLVCELDVPVAVGFLSDLPDAEVASIIAELDPDDAAEIIPAMPEEQAERVLDLMKDSASEPVEGLLSYEEETAGRIMSPEVFALEEHVPVADAIAALRTSRSEELEMVFYLYVVDDRRHLVGVCSLRELLLADPAENLDEVMNSRLTSVNTDVLTGKTLGDHEEIWFEASDGNRAHGWIVRPPDFDPEKKYPLLMEIHGGPFGMYVGAFNFSYQVFAANGFVVLYTNPRGSTGYGEAFSQAIDHAYPSVDYLDLMAGVDMVVAEGYIDEKRMYVGGCSGGGLLSSWVIGHTDRFAAAAVRCPVTNWMSMAGTTDIPYFMFSFFDKPFWEDPTDWLHHSSLMYVGNVKTPTAIMTGEQDMRTPMAQSEEYYAALKTLGVPTRLLRFNDQYHGTGTKPSNYMRTLLYMMSWYNRYTIDGEVETKEDDE